MVFLQNVTLSVAHKEARAHHGASGHYFRNGIKCWQSFCPCLHRATPATHTCGHTQALGQGWLGAPEGTASSSWASACEAASPGRNNHTSCQLSTSKLYEAQKYIQAPLCGYFQSGSTSGNQN